MNKVLQDQVNVFGEPLIPCSHNPKTGFYRTGCCETSEEDVGSHTVCAIMTDEFLSYSRQAGNDLSTLVPAFGFPGLQAGDQWCLCAARFLQAYQEGKAPRIVLRATHIRSTEIVPLEVLKEHAIDLN